jgi:diguanylate cyclase
VDSRSAIEPRVEETTHHSEPGLFGASDPAICRHQLELRSRVLESIGDAIIAHSLEGKIVYANERAANMLGYEHPELVSLEAWDWIAPELRNRIDSHIEQIRDEAGLIFETCCHGRDGLVVAVETHSRLVSVDPWGELVVNVSRDMADRTAAHETMRRLAFYDTLTGLSNRAMLEKRIEAALLGARTRGETVGLIYMDLDDFKPVNDTHGHAMGDRVLRIIGERMLNCVRDTDTIARVGGDEFIALFPNLPEKFELSARARALTECIAQPIGIEGVTVQVSVSVGLATYEPGEHHDELITRADHAMYRAKLHGWAGWEEFLANT